MATKKRKKRAVNVVDPKRIEEAKKQLSKLSPDHAPKDNADSQS